MGIDKLKHGLGMVLLATIFTEVGEYYLQVVGLWIALALCFAVIFGVEIWQKVTGKGVFDWYDILAGAIPTVAIFLMQLHGWY